MKAATQSVISTVGGQLRSALQQQAAAGNPVDLGGIVQVSLLVVILI